MFKTASEITPNYKGPSYSGNATLPSTSSNSGPVPKDKEDRLRYDITGYAEQFLGIEYKWAGMSPETGFDCSGLTSFVLANFDINVPHSAAAQEKEGKKVKINDVRPGDLIFYRKNSLGKVFHVSLVVDNNSEGITVIHSVSRGVVRENITKSSYWSPMVSSARNVVSR